MNIRIIRAAAIVFGCSMIIGCSDDRTLSALDAGGLVLIYVDISASTDTAEMRAISVQANDFIDRIPANASIQLLAITDRLANVAIDTVGPIVVKMNHGPRRTELETELLHERGNRMKTVLNSVFTRTYAQRYQDSVLKAKGRIPPPAHFSGASCITGVLTSLCARLAYSKDLTKVVIFSDLLEECEMAGMRDPVDLNPRNGPLRTAAVDSIKARVTREFQPSCRLDEILGNGHLAMVLVSNDVGAGLKVDPDELHSIWDVIMGKYGLQADLGYGWTISGVQARDYLWRE